MCCCIPLRRLSYLGAIGHMFVGLMYLYFLGSVAYTIYSDRDKPNAQPRLVMGLFYMAYFASFLPPGIFIFWGVHKKLRRFLVLPSIAFMIIQMYGIGLETYYGYRPQWLPEAIKKFNNEGDLLKYKLGFWMDVTIQVALTVVYLFMLFFYYREIGPESNPVQSRYAQAYHQQHGMDGGGPGGMGGGISQHPQMAPQQLGPPVPFRPVSLGHTSVPMSLSLLPSGQPCRNSTPLPPPSNFNLGALANLTYEQQQQLLKLQQHPLIIQQQQQLQHQHQQQQIHHQHQQSASDQVPHPLLQQQFHSYAQMLASNPKTPKF